MHDGIVGNKTCKMEQFGIEAYTAQLLERKALVIKLFGKKACLAVLLATKAFTEELLWRRAFVRELLGGKRAWVNCWEGKRVPVETVVEEACKM